MAQKFSSNSRGFENLPAGYGKLGFCLRYEWWSILTLYVDFAGFSCRDPVASLLLFDVNSSVLQDAQVVQGQDQEHHRILLAAGILQHVAWTKTK